jgi:hypothetical protein
MGPPLAPQTKDREGREEESKEEEVDRLDAINQRMKAILAHQHDELPAAESREGYAKVPRAKLEVAAEEVTVKQYEYRMLIDDYMTKQQE